MAISAIGSNVGLALLWRKKEMVEIFSYSRWHNSAWVQEEFQKPKWFLTKFYGEPEASKRHLTWILLREVKPLPNIPWFIIGDFNEISVQK